MNVEALLGEIATRLGALSGVTAHATPPDNIVAPAAFPNGDGEVTYGVTYGPVGVKVTLPYVMAVSRTWSAASWGQLLQFCAASGAKSVKALLEGDGYTNCDWLHVAGAEFGTVTIGSIDYVAAIFTLEIAGSEE